MGTKPQLRVFLSDRILCAHKHSEVPQTGHIFCGETYVVFLFKSPGYDACCHASIDDIAAIGRRYVVERAVVVAFTCAFRIHQDLDWSVCESFWGQRCFLGDRVTPRGGVQLLDARLSVGQPCKIKAKDFLKTYIVIHAVRQVAVVKGSFSPLFCSARAFICSFSIRSSFHTAKSMYFDQA